MRRESRIERQVNVERIHSYHCGEHNSPKIFNSDRVIECGEDYRLADGSLLPVFGIEVETQNWGISNSKIYANVLKKICMDSFPSDLWKIEADGSLTSNCDSSAECITQPMTKAFIRNHYRDFKAMYEWFEAMGISCDRTGDCGMHTHICNVCFGRTKRTQDEAIRKFLYIINKHYDLMRSLVYRRLDSDGSTYYFSRMDLNTIKSRDLNNFPNNHYVCVNMGHYEEGNIELRLVGGQKNFPCFRNTMEAIFHLIEASKRISWADCDNIVKIFKGCNNYVFDRLNSYVKREGLISESALAEIKESIVYEQFI